MGTEEPFKVTFALHKGKHEAENWQQRICPLQTKSLNKDVETKSVVLPTAFRAPPDCPPPWPQVCPACAQRPW